MKTMTEPVVFTNSAELIPIDVVGEEGMGDALYEDAPPCVRKRAPTIAGFVCTNRRIYATVVEERSGRMTPITESMALFYLPEIEVAGAISYHALLEKQLRRDLESYLQKHLATGVAVCGLQVNTDAQFSSAQACQFLLGIAWPSVPVRVRHALAHAERVQEPNLTRGWRLAVGASLSAVREIYLWPRTLTR